MPAPLSSQVQDRAIAMLATGMSQVETARQLDISGKTAHRIAKSNKKQIEAYTLQYVNKAVPLIFDNQLKTIQVANNIINDIQSDDIDTSINKVLKGKLKKYGISASALLNLANKDQLQTLQTIGVAASSTPSTVINNIFSQTTNNIIDPSAQKVIDAHCIDLLEDDSIQDAEVLTEDTINNDGDI